MLTPNKKCAHCDSAFYNKNSGAHYCSRECYHAHRAFYPGTPRRKYFVGMVRGCSTCGAEITVSESMVRYGRYRCTPCLSAQAKKSRIANIDHYRALQRGYAKNKPARDMSTYNRANPHKRRAHHAVQTAIRNGSLVKQPCSVCGASKAHAHHDDYAKPLDVMWLCAVHHFERHRFIAELDKEAP